ncbi:putative sodium-coupled neutral amino acid transporter 10 [Echinococcus granulosus]|nr:putative sodium-coupled neutral amino acid transporter 10 [Echinococcus granulosus]
MPFCFHECGVVLMIIALLLMTLATYHSCILTIKSINHFRCDSLERAAYKSHGTFGKRLVELCLIGLLFGMIVGLNVAISDLGSEVLSTVSSLKANATIRRCVLLFATVLVTPFCFFRRVDFLSATSSVAVIIYSIFLLDLMLAYAVPKVLSKHFSLEYFRFWRPEGLVRCVPIIASSLCCQVQVSTIYTSLKNPPLVIMKKVLIHALSFIFIYYSVNQTPFVLLKSVCLWKCLTSSLFLQQEQQTNNTTLEIQDTNT